MDDSFLDAWKVYLERNTCIASGRRRRKRVDVNDLGLVPDATYVVLQWIGSGVDVVEMFLTLEMVHKRFRA